VEQTFTAILHSATRRTNSGDGNPRYILNTSEGTFNTTPDASINYDVANRTESVKNWLGKRVKFTATGAGTISGWELAE
jgi:hypothetical protein